MAVRNYWLDARIDGRATPLEGGPRARDGGFTLTVYYRDDGGIGQEPLRIAGYCLRDGTLRLEVSHGTTLVYGVESAR